MGTAGTTNSQPGSVPQTGGASAPGTGAIAPATSAERISSLDFIRGLAVMGILWANIVAFGQPMSAYMYPEAFMVPAGDPGGVLWIVQFILIDGKMRGLFTLLFGAGLYLFMERAWARGATRWLQARRLVLLALFGLVHFFFIWFGDILFYYGLLGLVALLCMRWSATTQLWVGLAGYLLGGLFFAAALSFPHMIAETSIGESEAFAEPRTEMIAGIDDTLAEDAIPVELTSSGDYLGLAQYRLSEQWMDPLANLFFIFPEMLPLMLIGMALYRMGFFGDGFQRAGMIRWGWIALLVGAGLHLAIGLYVMSTGFAFYSTLAAFVGWSFLPRLAMVLGMAALLAAYSPAWSGWLAERVRAAGRAAFTNYLGTSVVMLFVFHGWALGLFGELNRPQLYIVVILTCALMLAWAKPWLERYRYGPLEWLWRCLTYGKIFPMKR